MENVLRSKGLYRITLGKENSPTNADKKVKWDNKNDEARGLIGVSISPDLRFHLQGINDLDEVWDKLQKVFSKHIVDQAHQLENQLISLNPNDFSCIEDYLSKFKTVRLLLKHYQIDMKDEQCLYAILAKLGSAYYVFVSTFHSTEKALGASYTAPSLEFFCDSMIR
jgi:hypothetical protein